MAAAHLGQTAWPSQGWTRLTVRNSSTYDCQCVVVHRQGPDQHWSYCRGRSTATLHVRMSVKVPQSYS